MLHDTHGTKEKQNRTDETAPGQSVEIFEINNLESFAIFSVASLYRHYIRYKSFPVPTVKSEAGNSKDKREKEQGKRHPNGTVP